MELKKIVNNKKKIGLIAYLTLLAGALTFSGIWGYNRARKIEERHTISKLLDNDYLGIIAYAEAEKNTDKVYLKRANRLLESELIEEITFPDKAEVKDLCFDRDGKNVYLIRKYKTTLDTYDFLQKVDLDNNRIDIIRDFNDREFKLYNKESGSETISVDEIDEIALGSDANLYMKGCGWWYKIMSDGSIYNAEENCKLLEKHYLPSGKLKIDEDDAVIKKIDDGTEIKFTGFDKVQAACYPCKWELK
ncbi:MAG: hypothetical protein AABX29_09750 [Nanoarchaeota archaeon]